MSLLGGVRSGVGGVRTSAESGTAGSAPTGGIQEITSSDGSIDVTDPTGPITDLKVAAGTTRPNLLDVTLSYGHGMDVDAELPPATSFWLTPTTVADLARADQVREWPTDQDLTVLGLDVCVTSSSGLGGGLPLIVTMDGSDTALTITIPDGIADETLFTVSSALSVAAGSFVGVRVDGSALGPGASVQLQARLRGSNAGAGGGLALVTHDATLQGSGTPSDPLGTLIRSLSGVNGVLVSADVSHNYTFRGSYGAQAGGSGLGATHAGGGLYTIDIANVGRQFDTARQLIGCFSLDALTLNDSQLFDWSTFSTAYKQSGINVLISKAWAVVRQFVSGPVVTAPVFSVSIGGTGNVMVPIGPTASQINNSAALGVPYAIPLEVIGKTDLTTIDLVNGFASTPPGLTAKVTTAATGPVQLDVVIVLALDLDVSSATNP